MADDLFVHKGYAVHSADGGALKSAGYALAAGYASDSKNGAYLLAAGYASDSKNGAYLLAAGYASASKNGAYIISSGSASLMASKGYLILQTALPPYEELSLITSFVDQRFPECVSYGSSGGPGFKTSIFEMDSGHTSEFAEWSRLRARYEVTFENATPADIQEVDSFFYGMRGQGVAFRYKDFSDYQITSQNMGVGNGTVTEFDTFKRYSSGGHHYDRPIKKLVDGTVSGVTVNGVSQTEGTDYFIIPNLGKIQFVVAPSKGDVVFVGYIEFDVPVRFATDKLDVSSHSHFQHNIQGLSLVEVLVV